LWATGRVLKGRVGIYGTKDIRNRWNYRWNSPNHHLARRLSAEAHRGATKVHYRRLVWMLDSWAPGGMQVWELVAAVVVSTRDACEETQLSVDIPVAAGPEQGRTIVKEGAPNAGVSLQPGAKISKLMRPRRLAVDELMRPDFSRWITRQASLEDKKE
jgi:hypothetical protein